jgi:hypothetical protein
MGKPYELLPPDTEQLELAVDVNRRLIAPSRVNFFRVKKPEGDVQYGMVISHGVARTNLFSDAPWFNPEDVVKEVTAFVKSLSTRRPMRERWTSELPEETPF